MARLARPKACEPGQTPVDNLACSQHVNTGWAAVQAMNDFRPDGVILDINMPGLDGFGVLEAKQERAPIREIPVLMLTARHAADDVRRALALGASDYLAKPFDDRQMLIRVRRLVGKRRTPPPAVTRTWTAGRLQSLGLQEGGVFWLPTFGGSRNIRRG